ncbi:hypothetical protein AMJ44_11240 [candidate division WOR-1 bacterium DG_54_3]|uniref:NrpR transcriptional repressor n=1 Tax=candidate division WOR-1 bacterium DG_54_3 TaxID=1703775 RepID=A0A0S7XRL0_UNCSA|nr:MAG: hypothetical protein AMJ44_11240 [candidate division WOR-1 bacterium DG_54_3]
MEKKINSILKIIDESREPIGSPEISARLRKLGIEMSERTVRYHLKTLDKQGLTRGKWKEGRTITGKGREELGNALVFDKVGFLSSKFEAMAFRMDFDLDSRSGEVILNLSLFHKSDFKSALRIMKAVFDKGFATGNKVVVAEAGQEIGGIVVPAGKVGFGTLCSINLNGILLKHSIPVDSRFGGMLQIEDSRPLRFTDMISYSGSTLDPHEVFLKSKMTSVREATNGSGKILASLREIPAVSKNEAEAILRKADSAGLGKVLLIGRTGLPVLGMPVGMERVGIVVPGGLNPVAACEEWGIETESKALVTLIDYSRLKNFWECV